MSRSDLCSDCELTGSCMKCVQWEDYFVFSSSSIYWSWHHEVCAESIHTKTRTIIKDCWASYGRKQAIQWQNLVWCWVVTIVIKWNYI